MPANTEAHAAQDESNPEISESACPCGTSDALTSAVDESISHLWELYRGRLKHEVEADRELQEAGKRLPWWVRSGPKLINSNGEFHGPDSDYPAIVDFTLPSNPGVSRVIRPSEMELEGYCNSGFWPPEIGKKKLAIAMRSLEERKRAADFERDRVGWTRLDKIYQRASQERWEAKWRILDLAPTSTEVAAAQFLIDCIDGVCRGDIPISVAEIETSMLRLRKLLPYLSGRLADDSRRYLATVDQPAPALGYEPE